MQSISRVGIALVVLASLQGCGRDSSAGLQQVHGHITFNGRPTAHAQVTFHPVNASARGGVRPVGTVDEQGNFTLTSLTQGDGVPPGDYRVTVVWYLARLARPGSDETVSANYLPTKYASVETSDLAVTVKPGETELKPFNLK